jgi:hypothetical protein
MSMDPICHVGILYTTTVDFTVKGVTYPPGSYVFHAHTQNGVIIEPIDNVLVWYDMHFEVEILHFGSKQVPVLLALMERTLGTHYGMSQVINIVRWEGGATSESGIMCVTLVQMYLNDLGYVYVMQTVSPALLYRMMHRRKHIYVTHSDGTHDLSYRYRVLLLLVTLISIIAGIYTAWCVGRSLVLWKKRKNRPDITYTE